MMFFHSRDFAETRQVLQTETVFDRMPAYSRCLDDVLSICVKEEIDQRVVRSDNIHLLSRGDISDRVGNVGRSESPMVQGANKTDIAVNLLLDGENINLCQSVVDGRVIDRNSGVTLAKPDIDIPGFAMAKQNGPHEMQRKRLPSRQRRGEVRELNEVSGLHR
ncbi:hypothetical protein KDL45_12995 [bacterium]|nr:hypothetical protein [bacterium]